MAGDYDETLPDGPALTRALLAIKRECATGDHIVLASAPSLPYEALIVALDLTRAHEGVPLYPNVTLAGGL